MKCFISMVQMYCEKIVFSSIQYYHLVNFKIILYDYFKRFQININQKKNFEVMLIKTQQACFRKETDDQT
jgi:hypothetical protein